MFYVEKIMEISASHKLNLNYESKCSNLHGHNWKIKVYMKSVELDENGMVYDFSKIKSHINDKIDHKNLNEVLDFNPTAENIAKWVTDMIPECYKASVRESEGNVAVYVADEEPCGCVFEEDCPE